MRISARNQMTGNIHAFHKGAINTLIEIIVAPGVIVSSTITNEAFEELGLDLGKDVVAIIKSSDIMVGVSDWEAGYPNANAK
ncbi:molybdenum-pterin-binding protein [Acetobacteraceae bacterium]|nr:molybdenum-pterin-binding protein [Acetobacteraceae bacterium]